jgi:isoaspartyl peptidase/L-asparaginase-like protein (Ntn-hydrolase superfamily)
MENKWAIIATWGFSINGLRKAADMLGNGQDAFDASEQLARMVEDDPEVTTVGFGSFPNAKGELELDAAFMNGRDLSLGCVMSVKGFKNPVSIARKVMTGSPHNVLSGQGAEEFADANGCERAIMLTDSIRKEWDEKIAEQKGKQPDCFGHDTVGVVTLDTAGEIASATSTSGLAMKQRGRVGDSPLVGCGFFADNDVGGAAATGIGEDIMKGCTCFVAVELMRQGYPPQQAAQEAVRRTHRRLARHSAQVGAIAVVCANKDGEFGAASNHENFTYVAASYLRQPAVYEVGVEDIIR